MDKITDLGKIGITIGGEYDNNVIYEKLTIVLYKGKSYISTKTTQGIFPDEDILTWQLVAEAKDAYHMLVDAGKTTLTEEEFLKQLEDATKGRYIVQGNIVNAADEEDLTVEHSNLLGTDVLKFKDKAYNPLTYSGMGRKILRKNMVNGVNTLTQSMINQANTIYVIQYDFILGEDITIPDNCMLKFDGGSITASDNNDTIAGNNTRINGNVKFEDVIFSGTWVTSYINSKWFNYTYYPNIFKAISVLGTSNNLTKVDFEKTIVNLTIVPDEYSEATNTKYAHIFNIPSNIEINFCNSQFTINNNDIDVCRFFVFRNVHNVKIKNVSLFGDVAGHTKISTLYNEDCHGLYFAEHNYNIELENVESSKFWADGICFSEQPDTETYQGSHDIKVYNCIFDSNRRLGISMSNGLRIFYDHCVVRNTGRIAYTEPGSGVDLETEQTYYNMGEVYFNCCKFYNNVGEDAQKDVIIHNPNHSDFNSDDFVFTNCYIKDKIAQRGSGGTFKECYIGAIDKITKNITFQNNIINTNYVYPYSKKSNNILFLNNIWPDNKKANNIPIICTMGRIDNTEKCLKINIPKVQNGHITIDMCLLRYDLDTNHNYRAHYVVNNGSLIKVKDEYFGTKPLTLDDDIPFKACVTADNTGNFFIIYIAATSMYSRLTNANIHGKMKIFPDTENLESCFIEIVPFSYDIRTLDYTILS